MKGLPWGRKLFHFSGCIVPLIYLLTDSRGLTLAMTLVCLILTIIIDGLRIKGYITWQFLQSQIKEKERRSFSGTLFFMVSSLITVLVFDKHVAVASLLVLCIADPLSSVVGITWGKRPLFGKTAEGTMAFFLSSLAILACFPFMPSVAIGGALAGTVTELFSLRRCDDNLSIPIVTGLALTILAKVFGPPAPVWI
jgi:dolichol kinase